MLRKLDWDSEFFEVPVYSLEVTSPIRKEDIRGTLGHEGDALLYVYLKDDHSGLHDQLVSQGALFYDTRIIFLKKLDTKNRIKGSVAAAEYKGSLCDSLIDLALDAGEFSRFKGDPRLKPYFEGLYTTWIGKSLSGEMADKVFVYRPEGVVKGFATCSIKGSEGWTGLISVHASDRGKGIGTSLMATIEDYYIEKHIEHSLVITQEENLKACRFYESCGYQINQREFIYHWWI